MRPQPISDRDPQIDWKLVAACVIHGFDKQRLDLDSILRLDDENPTQALYDAKQLVRKLLKEPQIEHDFHGQCHYCGATTDDTETVASLRQTLARYAARDFKPEGTPTTENGT